MIGPTDRQLPLRRVVLNGDVKRGLLDVKPCDALFGPACVLFVALLVPSPAEWVAKSAVRGALAKCRVRLDVAGRVVILTVTDLLVAVGEEGFARLPLSGPDAEPRWELKQNEKLTARLESDSGVPRVGIQLLLVLG